MIGLLGLIIGANWLIDSAQVIARALGVSDLVIVNLREIQAADAANLEIDALADYQKARADFMVSTGRSP